LWNPQSLFLLYPREKKDVCHASLDVAAADHIQRHDVDGLFFKAALRCGNAGQLQEASGSRDALSPDPSCQVTVTEIHIAQSKL
jgi:hypothetical protein